MRRVSAKNWLATLDNSFRVTTGLPGLSYFKAVAGSAVWEDWRQFPRLTVGMDQGPDGMCGLHAAQYHFGLNVEAFMDPSHGCHNDLDRSIQACGLRPLVLLLLVSFNLPFGPMREDYRHLQIKEHMRLCFERQCSHAQPLYVSLAGKIVEAYERMGHEFHDRTSREEQCWELLAARAHFCRQGRKATLCRFLAIVTTLRERLPYWYIDLFERTYVCIEEDFLKGRGLERLALRPGPTEVVAEGGSSTNARVPQWDDKEFRSGPVARTASLSVCSS